ncbi:TadE family type IV pilus minor pilin [Tomitella biformata]|uniref:TadE family type IV pilus minor pilin n=1 Tax=Tomitella biformata TaxID=630403 RepID=UPI0004AC659C|nr:TadE family type IV pilus minor pilin [Tomitella biformata]
MATVEAALALAALIVVVVSCVGAILAVGQQVQCVDAAREAARLAARGDTAWAEEVAGRVAPAGASITVRVDGDTATATVRAQSALLPLVSFGATAVAAMEPEVG